MWHLSVGCGNEVGEFLVLRPVVNDDINAIEPIKAIEPKKAMSYNSECIQ